jgi:hypothetical protein
MMHAMNVKKTGLKDHNHREIMHNKKTGAMFVNTKNGKVYNPVAKFRGNGKVASANGIPMKVRSKMLKRM